MQNQRYNSKNDNPKEKKDIPDENIYFLSIYNFEEITESKETIEDIINRIKLKLVDFKRK